MKKYTFLILVCFVLFFPVSALSAQQQGGFTGPEVFSTLYAPVVMQGFTGPAMTYSVMQAAQTLPDKARAILRGNIVSYLGGELYLFRDSSGEIIVKIKHDSWWGLSVGPSDLVELGGEMKREKNGMIKHFDIKSIRRGA